MGKGKRKREDRDEDDAGSAGASKGMRRKEQPTQLPARHTGKTSQGTSTTVQIIIGTYEKVVHGMAATISKEAPNGVKKRPHVEFADLFLLSAHDAAVRCLALSPQKSQKIMLASGSSDQAIQIYQLSTHPPLLSRASGPSMPSMASNKIVQNPKNRSLGALEHHGGVINALCFPSRSKLLSAADDSTIAVTRTRDWTVLSTIKAPIPKAHGRPSGDTAPHGGTPAGVNDFAVHPSMKLMVSVGKGEKCMRLWNLVTGKKAGVLNFERNILQGVGEGKWASGEGRRVRWNSVGEEFVVAFDRGCVVYGIDSKPKCRILPSPSTKVHQIRYMPLAENENGTEEVLAISTEDGRVMFYSTDAASANADGEQVKSEVKSLQPIALFGGVSDGLTGRIKDFEALRLPDATAVLIITCGSDGAIRLWLVEDAELTQIGKKMYKSASKKSNGTSDKLNGAGQSPAAPKPVGQLIGLYESKNRITCLAAFLMSRSIINEASGLQNVSASAFDEEEEEEEEATETC